MTLKFNDIMRKYYEDENLNQNEDAPNFVLIWS